MLNPWHMHKTMKKSTFRFVSMQQRIVLSLITSLAITSPLLTKEDSLSLDMFNAQFPKHCSWRESTLFYTTQKENAEGNKALIGGIGVRSTTLSAKNRNHPSWYPSLVGLIGLEKKHDLWDWKSSLEAEFQGPSFNPIYTTRYTAELLGSRTFNEQFSAQAGAGIMFGIRSTNAYPIIGCIYTHDRWTFKLLYPKILLLSNKLNEKNTIGAFIANTLSHTYRAKKAYGRKDAICNFDAQFAGLMWDHYFTKKTCLSAALGWCLNADIKVGNKRNNHKKTVLDEGGGLLASLSIKTTL